MTATGAVDVKPAAVAAATAGQSIHQRASTLESAGTRYPPAAQADPMPRPLARMASRTRLIRPRPGVGGS
ncbi:hypothetical protein MFORT_16644 [Mycolicibacterium fortuitum subsp. fortuitum DSM 46621 = ATCC 6841 = JCM 6387]|uniref:Uncharacterized protein n=1 Tax=Mycolicibacterium fortuitum subsp. fortuitum DSM 46621 = ATCC 6841 = JCM 6387 TaxID=1214102 RepID=K0V5Q2_MYCFO|nr:hypothetical protein MFORT_16644 [Mycolicibacterium fortuitum subsp. fortuitum DSM 46621 = ATCC 6841 = JCM 6387]